MDVFYKIVSLLGGLALFLYGMRIMGDGLKSSSGSAMRTALAKVTDKPVKGFILGCLVTCMIQSSTATIVLTVGLVGAGFLSFRQSVGIVLGANVGTAITAQIIRLMDLHAGATSILYFFKSDNLAPLALIIGIILIMFVHTRAASSIGTIFMGFGVLFVGLMNMSTAVSSFGDTLSHFLVSFENNYFLGFLAGVLVTGVIQSSSAVVGILQTIASSVGIRFCGVFAVIVGVNIGDCLTTYLVCRIGAKPDQIRTCLVHIIYNIFAAIMVFAAVGILRATGVLNDSIWYMTLNSGGVANVHGLFRLVPALLLLPFSGKFADMAEKIVPDRVEEDDDLRLEKNLKELDDRLISNPGVALHESAELIGHMAETANHNYESSVRQAFEYDENRDKRIHEREDLLDRMADAVNQYVISIGPNITLETDDREQSFQLKAMTCFERIGDLSLNMAEDINRLRESGHSFSDTAISELNIATDAVHDILELSVSAYMSGRVDLAKKVEPLEETIDDLLEYIRSRHIHRMTHKQCNIYAGIEYQNLLQNLERISDQCSDLAVYLISRSDRSIIGQEHQYLHMIHHSENPEYQKEYHDNTAKYFGRLEALPEKAEKQEKQIKQEKPEKRDGKKNKKAKKKKDMD